MNKPNTSKEIKSVTKNLPMKGSSVPYAITAEFQQTFKGGVTQIYLKLFQKIEGGRVVANNPKLIYKICIIQIPIPEKDTIRKENYKPASLMNITAKISHKMVVN